MKGLPAASLSPAILHGVGMLRSAVMCSRCLQLWLLETPPAHDTAYNISDGGSHIPKPTAHEMMSASHWTIFAPDSLWFSTLALPCRRCIPTFTGALAIAPAYTSHATVLVAQLQLEMGYVTFVGVTADVARSSEVVWFEAWPASSASSARFLPSTGSPVEANSEEVQPKGHTA